MRLRRFWMMMLSSATLGAAVVPALAQPYPNKSIRVIVGFAAGGGNDIIVRVLAPRLTEALGQAIIIDNRPGAQGIIAAELAARANSDGYTLLMGPIGTMAMNPAIYSKL